MKVQQIFSDRTLLEWYEERSKIDLEPSYQRRGYLWPIRSRRLLINSVLNQYDIPKIYLADLTYGKVFLNTHRKPYAVIDGKQRFLIFFDFFTNQLELDDTPVNFAEESLNLNGLRYDDLKQRHPAIALLYENYIPTVMGVIADRVEEVQELFIRLNLNVSISGPERRNALPGPVPKLIRNLSVHEFFRMYATFPNNRGQDLNLAAKFLLMEQSGGFANVKKADLDRFVINNEGADPNDFNPIFDAASENLDRMNQVFYQQDRLLRPQAQLTVYYWLVKVRTDVEGKIMRAFLVEFEQARMRERALMRARVTGQTNQAPNVEMLEYLNAVRTPDDRSRQQFMFEMLNRLLDDFLTAIN
jgi:hypothetical protein